MLKENESELTPALAVSDSGLQIDRTPNAPAWFHKAIMSAPVRSFVSVDGVQIETLAWGQIGKPGLLFLPGNSAQADWWSFIAPFFADDFRVAAISWSGMGRSGWRATYTMEQHMQEAWLCAEAVGLFESRIKPVFIAHSFGGGVAMKCARHGGGRLRKAIIVDNGVWQGLPPTASRPAGIRVYSDSAEALAHFRLRPEQSCANDFLLHYIAQHAIRKCAMNGVERQAGLGGSTRARIFRAEFAIWKKAVKRCATPHARLLLSMAIVPG